MTHPPWLFKDGSDWKARCTGFSKYLGARSISDLVIAILQDYLSML